MIERKNNLNLQYNNTAHSSKIRSTKSSKLPVFRSAVSNGQNTSGIKFLLIGIIALIFFSLAAAPVSAYWDGTTNNTSWYNGHTSPFIISTEEDLAGLAYLVNGGTDFSDKIITLGADLNLTKPNGLKNDWTPIGTESKPFKGIFNGNNHTISNLYINNLSANYQGLFGLTGGANLKNIGLTGVSVIGNSRVGGLVGYNYGGTIENCYAAGTVEGKDGSVGGLVGFNEWGTIENCYAAGTVEGKDGSVGGLVGYNCARDSEIATITNCYAEGNVRCTIMNTGNNVGGLVGENFALGSGIASITNCYATGNVNGTGDVYANRVGGLVGYNYVDGSGTVSIENCYATGTVTGEGTGYNYVGGLVGENYAQVSGTTTTIEDCYATGTVTSESTNINYVGGLVGYNNVMNSGTAIIENCYATGTVTGTGSIGYYYIGGLVGKNFVDGSGTAKIRKSVALNPSVSGPSNIGRVVGINNSGTLDYNYANNGMTISRAVTDGLNTIDGLGKLLDDLKDKSTYTEELGWNFITTWVMKNDVENKEGITNEYPILKCHIKKVTFDSNGGSPDNYFKNVMSGTVVIKPADPTRGGDTFKGWYKDSELTTPYIFETTPVIRDITLYANWTSIYNVTFNNNGGTGTMDKQSFIGGETKKLSKNTFTKTGHNFTGWNTDNGDQIDYVDEEAISITKDTTLYAVWKANVTNITLNATGGTGGTQSINITYGAQIYTPEEIDPPTKAMYAFNGWYNESDGGVEIINSGGYIMAEREGYTGPNSTWINDTREITLYAKWALLHNVTFNSTSGTGTMANQSIGEGMTAILNESTYSKEGYNFAGWNKTDINGTTVDYADKAGIIMGTSDINLFAVWVIKPSPAPTRPSSGGSTDTGSGHYSDYPRNVPESGDVSFGSSPVVTGVDFPKGTSGSTSLHIPTSGSAEYKEIVLSLTNDKGEKQIISLFDITAPDTKGETSKINFKVKLSDIKDGFDTKDVKMYHRLNDGTWEALDTFLVEEKDGYAYYYSETESFSPFAIVYEEDGAAEVSQPAVTPVKTQTAEPVSTYVEPTKTAVPTPEQTKSPVGLVGLGLGLLGAFAVLRRK